ncbi:M23 family metallopeptidase [Rickettsia endosymbiont of Cardiosporidium cionae]|uniref:M23 family metallopeptidase n=1 Tax=Rickettsia endosymbiont of Cardiosporidium cionae TaxID=2777155 RepID=UPI001894FE9F|nr:M23 family metallopeptidase [Rickettsia endosymbiont of Cardiosporidium cionae]KAF8818739.1 hypothetical protein IHI24_000466 [Rickettsia endosymbiont of Cardiosporidium cionae]
MIHMKFTTLAIISFSILTGCMYGIQEAPIVHHNIKISDKIDRYEQNKKKIVPKDNNISNNLYDTTTNESNIFELGNNIAKEIDTNIIYHEVQFGENIESIASEYNQTVHDIAELNQLTPPYILKELQILKINLDNNFPVNQTSADKNLSQNKQNIHEQNINKQNVKAESVKQKLIKPVNGAILSAFGEKTSYGVNPGINISAKSGTEVKAAASGKIIYADFDATFGNLVIIKIDHADIVHIYAHLQKTKVTIGDIVQQSCLIGYVGSTGKVKQSQLHFGIKENKKSINPTKYLKYK